MRRPHGVRGGIAMGVVLALVAVAAVGVAALALHRRSVTRGVAAARLRAALLRVGTGALEEAARPSSLEAALRSPAVLEELARAFRDGEVRGGILVPAGGAFAVAPTQTRVALGEGFEVSDVEVLPLYYLPSGNRGRFRLLVEVAGQAGPLARRRLLAHDVDLHLVGSGAGLRVWSTGAPVARIHS